MAQPVDLPLGVFTFIAGADLSAKQYHWVYISGDFTVSAAGTSQALIGILQNAPASGKVAEVMLYGLSKAYVGTGDVTYGHRVGSDTDGTCITKASDAGITGGVCLMSAVAGTHTTVLLTPNTQRAS